MPMVIPHLLVTRLSGEGNNKVNHKGVHFDSDLTLPFSHNIHDKYGHTIASANYHKMTSTHNHLIYSLVTTL